MDEHLFGGEMGIVSISVDYRGYEGTAENRDISQCIADAKSAFRWVSPPMLRN
jgi:hypothetical protein